MIPEPLKPAYRTRINVRPTKCAMLIAAGNMKQLRAAALDCCTMWGGITNLIVPLDSRLKIGSLDRYLLELHEPDAVVSYLPTRSTSGQRRHERIRSNIGELVGTAVPFHAADQGGSDLGCHVLNVIRDEDLARRQFLSRHFVARNNREELTLIILFGQVYPGQEPDYAEITRVGVKPTGFDDLLFWGDQTVGDWFSSPINLTGYGYGPYEVGGSFGSNLFEVVLGDGVDDLCYFWNLRATRTATRFGDRTNRVLLAPNRAIDDEDSLGRLADVVKGVGPTDGVESEVELLAYAAAAEVEKFSELGGSVQRFLRYKGQYRVTRRFARSSSPSSPSGPVTWTTPALSLPTSLKYGAAFEGYELIPFDAGSNEVRVASPSGHVDRGSQPVMLDIDSDVWSRYPKSQASAQVVLSNGRWTRHGLSLVGRLGRHPSYMPVVVPNEFEMVRRYFLDHGLEIRETKLSGYFDAVVRLLGGYSQLSVLTSPCSYQLGTTCTTDHPQGRPTSSPHPRRVLHRLGKHGCLRPGEVSSRISCLAPIRRSGQRVCG